MNRTELLAALKAAYESLAASFAQTQETKQAASILLTLIARIEEEEVRLDADLWTADTFEVQEAITLYRQKPKVHPEWWQQVRVIILGRKPDER